MKQQRLAWSCSISSLGDKIESYSIEGWQVVPSTQIILPMDDKKNIWVGIVMEKIVTDGSCE